MPSIGGPELLLILAVVLIVFGAGKLPDVLGQLGKGVRSFRDESTNDKAASVTAGSTTSAATAAPGTTAGSVISPPTGSPHVIGSLMSGSRVSRRSPRTSSFPRSASTAR